MKHPRPYQETAVASIWDYFLSGRKGNPIVAMPTGTGKSLTMGEFDRQVISRYPDQHILNLTHVKELIKGNHEALLDLDPTIDAAIYSAGLKSKQVGQVTFAGIMSVKGKPELFKRTNLIKIDECHLVSDSEATTYLRFINQLKEYNPALKVIGFSATPWRSKSGMLTETDEETGEPKGIFTDICCDYCTGDAFLWFIDEGYLIAPVPFRTDAQIDVEGVHTRAGDYVEGELEAAIDAQDIIRRALDEAIMKAADRRHWIIFATSIRHAEEISDYLNAKGIAATSVHSKLPGDERDKRIAAFKAGRFRVLVNKNILTTGFDYPGIDCIVLLRPTRSPGLHVQIIGRGTRPVYAPGFDLSTTNGRLTAIQSGPKQDCLVLDFAGNTERLGPINYPTIPDPKRKRKGGTGEAPSKVCDSCGCIVHPTVRVCPNCGEEFHFEEQTTHYASEAELIRRDKPKPEKVEKVLEAFAVDHMAATIHRKAGRPNSVRVEYYCGARRFTKFVTPEHEGGGRRLAEQWWKAHAAHMKMPCPDTADAIVRLFEYIQKPAMITVWLNTKYPEVISYDDATNFTVIENP